MKIREVMDKKVGNKKYTRFILTIPKDQIRNSKLLGKEIKVISKKDEIIIRKARFK